jgi:tetratricopeptide (TPR) repeat protein
MILLKLMRYRLLLLIYIVSAVPLTLCSAEWKELKLLKSYIKSSDIGKGRELVSKCLKDTNISQSPQLYTLATSLEVKANDAENMKLYLHQKYDTTGFFNSVCNIFEYTLKEEKILWSTNPKKAQKKQSKNQDFLRRYYPNLFSGGLYFVKNKQWSSANRLLSMYIDITQSGYLEKEKSVAEAKLPRAAFWSMVASYEDKNYEGVFKYQNLAETDSANFDYALQYESMAYDKLRDTVNYVKSLRRGLGKSESSDYFFSRLNDFLNDTHNYREARTLNDSLLVLFPDNKLYLFAQTAVLFNLEMYDSCLEMANRLLSVDLDNIQVCYYIGLCWYNKGVGYESTLTPNPTSVQYKKRMKEVRQMYQKAMPYLEKYKEAFPKENAKWQAPLYKIYFSLNMASKLKEIENS